MYIHFLDQTFEEEQNGAKAFNLSKMKQAGFPVPEGFVLNNLAYNQVYLNGRENDQTLFLELEAALDIIQAKSYMVRSSAIGEDRAGSSFAGQLDSFICGNNIQEILEKINACWASCQNDHVKVYESQFGIRLSGMGVIVQKLIDPDFAGVLFTRHPENEEEILIEFVEGHGEKLVSGKVTPQSMRWNSKMDLPDPLFKELIHLSKRLEQLYTLPLDIEWAIKDNLVFIVQARPITANAKSKQVFWSNTNVNENYPEAISPLLYSIARDAYYNYFKNLSKLFMIPESKISELESEYANVIGIFGSRMYYNMSSIHHIISASPFSDVLMKSFDQFVGYTADQKTEKTYGGSKFQFMIEVLNFNRQLKKTVADFEHRVDQYSSSASNAIAFSELRIAFHGFIEIRMHSWYKASLADFFAMLYHGILGKFCRRFYTKDAEGVHNKLIQAIPNLISSEPIVEMYQIKMALKGEKAIYDEFKSKTAIEFWHLINNHQSNKYIKDLIDRYIENWGFRCSGELMLQYNTYVEEPHKFIELLQQYDALPDSNPSTLIQAKFQERKQVIKAFKVKIIRKRGLFFPLAIIEILILNTLIKLATKGISARERVRLKQALLYFKFKQVLQKTGLEFMKRGIIKHPADLHFLRYQEIAENFASSDQLASNIKERIKLRREAFEATKDLVYPDDFSSNIGQYPLPKDIIKPLAKSKLQNGDLNGLSVCGGRIKAKARVLLSVMEAHKLQKGDILVTRQTDPGWVLVFPLISGLIVERGGMLSHGAIVSREFGIPAIVGVENASLLIKDGDLLDLNADTGEIQFCNE